MTTFDQQSLRFGWNGLELAGSLHLPDTDGPYPVVVLAQGSGPADRDSGGYFGPIRRTFLSRGIAVFAFDKPGCGQSSGDWRDHGLQGRADQLLAAIELMADDEAVDADRVGVWGHSQGGWLVQMLAGRRIGLAFCIINSGPTISVREQILYDVEQSMRDRGHEEEQVREAIELTRALQRAAAERQSFESIHRQLLDPASSRPWYEDYPAVGDAADWRHLTRLLDEDIEPTRHLETVECPVLVVYGGLDRLLPPWRGAEESGRALAEAATTDATVVVFPTGDHRIQDPQTTEFVDGYLDLLGDWTASRIR